MDINNLTKERQEELDELFKEEITSLKENKITREEFIKIIRMKTTSLLDLYYLFDKYIGKVIIVEENSINSMLDNIKESLANGDIYFHTADTLDISYNSCQKQKTPHIKHLKKIKKYDNKNKFNRNKL